MHRFFLSFLHYFLLLLVLSCTNNGKNEVTEVLQISKSDFHNTIIVNGYLEAEHSKSITTPQLWASLKIIYLIEDGNYIKPGDTVCIIEAAELHNNFTNSEKELEIAKAEYNKTEQNLNLRYLLLESQVKSIETTTRIKKLDSIQQNFVSESDKKIIELELLRSDIERKKILSNLKFLKKINESELKKTKLKIKQAENNVNRTREMLDKLVIVSQEEGLVQIATNWSTGKKIVKGDDVWGNQPLVNLPDLSRLQVRLVANEMQYKRISSGQIVQIKVDANPEITCSGKIITKAPAGKPIIKESNVKIYDIFVEIDSSNFVLTPGLTVTCKVILDHLPNTLTVPITAIMLEDTNAFVLKKVKNNLVKTQVKIARQSEIEAVISNGLKENDIISINYSSSQN